MHRQNAAWLPVAAALLAASPALADEAGTAQAGTGAEATSEAAPTTPAAPAKPSTTADEVLLARARYWLGRHDLVQAQEAIERAVEIAPGSADALALQVQIREARGDHDGAQAALQQLRSDHPDDPRTSKLETTVRIGPVDPSALAESRHLAADGDLPSAVASYKTTFKGEAPPAEYALEYWQTLAGTQTGWEQARHALGDLVRSQPNDVKAQIGYAEVLTYRQATRAQGIARLKALAHSPDAPEAAQAWRRALGWLPQDSTAVPLYQAWLDTHPDDAEIAAKLAAARNPSPIPADEAGRARAQGFAALDVGHLDVAEKAFRAALEHDGQDADALGGLGLVRLRQGAAGEASDLLSRAVAADPDHRDRWEQALDGAKSGETFADVRHLVASGRIQDAEDKLRGIIEHGGRDADGARSMLAGLQGRRRGNAAAMPDPGTRRGDVLRRQARLSSDPEQKVALLRAAVAAAPSDTWATLDLARALASHGDKAEARGLVAALIGSTHPSTDALHAAALFAAEDERPSDAVALIERLPPAARTPDLRAILERDIVRASIQSALAGAAVDPYGARQRLLAIASHPDPDGSVGSAVARALVQLRDKEGAREALRVAQAATAKPTPAQRIAYAGALLEAGDPVGAGRLAASLDGATDLSAEQHDELDKVRAGAAVTASDALRLRGQVADAYDRLAPALARDPADPSLNLALARLYTEARDPRRALAINQAVLTREPANGEARRGAVAAAIQAGDMDRAETLVREGLDVSPHDPLCWIAAADLDRARGANSRALRDLRTARELRAQQVGAVSEDESRDAIHIAAVDDEPGPFRRGGGAAATAEAAVQVTGTGNPFRQPGDGGSETVAGNPGATDPIAADIEHQIAALQDVTAPQVSLGPAVRVRSGSSGLDKLREVSAPVEGSVPLGGGRVRFAATPTLLSAGEVATTGPNPPAFGTAPLGSAASTGSQQASGVGLDAAYSNKWVSADVGTTPLGFRVTNVVGGVEVAPEIASGTRLRLTAERRAVTDSVLSYAGTKDPATGTVWGGVTRTGGHGQLEFSVGDATFYAGGGYAAVDGTRVASNTKLEAGAGGSYPVWRQGDDQLRVGLDLVYFSYDKNLRFFTLGQGGYFSPQSYVAGLVPLTYSHADDKLKWSVGASLGYQAYHENASSVFPNDPALQSQLVAKAAGVPGAVTSYPGTDASGPVGGVNGSVEYRLTPALSLGGRASYQHAGDWSETSGIVFAKFHLQGDAP